MDGVWEQHERLIKTEGGREECERRENKAGLITEAFSGQCIQNTPAELLVPWMQPQTGPDRTETCGPAGGSETCPTEAAGWDCVSSQQHVVTQTPLWQELTQHAEWFWVLFLVFTVWRRQMWPRTCRHWDQHEGVPGLRVPEERGRGSTLRAWTTFVLSCWPVWPGSDLSGRLTGVQLKSNSAPLKVMISICVYDVWYVRTNENIVFFQR